MSNKDKNAFNATKAKNNIIRAKRDKDEKLGNFLMKHPVIYPILLSILCVFLFATFANKTELPSRIVFSGIQQDANKLARNQAYAIKQDIATISNSFEKAAIDATLIGSNDSKILAETNRVIKSLSMFKKQKYVNIVEDINSVATEINKLSYSKENYSKLLNAIDDLGDLLVDYKELNLEVIPYLNANFAYLGEKAFDGNLSTLFNNTLNSIVEATKANFSDENISDKIKTAHSSAKSFSDLYEPIKENSNSKLKLDGIYKKLASEFVKIGNSDKNRAYKKMKEVYASIEGYDLKLLSNGYINSLSQMIFSIRDKIRPYEGSSTILLPNVKVPKLFTPVNEYKLLIEDIKMAKADALSTYVIMILLFSLLVVIIFMLKFYSINKNITEWINTCKVAAKRRLRYLTPIVSELQQNIDVLVKKFEETDFEKLQHLQSIVANYIRIRDNFEICKSEAKSNADAARFRQDELYVIMDEAKETLAEFLKTTVTDILENDVVLANFNKKLEYAEQQYDIAEGNLDEIKEKISFNSASMSNAAENGTSLNDCTERGRILNNNSTNAKAALGDAKKNVAKINSSINERKNELAKQYNSEQEKLEIAVTSATKDYNEKVDEAEQRNKEFLDIRKDSIAEKIAEAEKTVTEYQNQTSSRNKEFLESDTIISKKRSLANIEATIAKLEALDNS